MGSSPFFSVVCAVYNCEKFLHNCINSVLNQDFTDFELILVDDGSTDKSGEICDYYAKIDSRVSTFHKPNGGLLSTRIFGIEKAKGDYILSLDADDSFKNGAFSVIKNAIKETDCDCLMFDFDVIENGVGEAENNYQKMFLTEKDDIFKYVFSTDRNNSVCRKAYKRNLIEFDYNDHILRPKRNKP